MTGRRLTRVSCGTVANEADGRRVTASRPCPMKASSYTSARGQSRTRLTQRSMLRRLVILSLIVCATSASAEAPLSSSAIATTSSQLGVDVGLPMADRVVVHKAERRLELLHKGEVLRSYKIALGLRPEGHKQFEGDFRTPEGTYRLVRRNPNSEYFLSIQISYPNETDIKRARRQGLSPGGAIMIHGQPNIPTRSRDYYQSVDWTEGCIAVSNSDMVEIWLMTSTDTPIEIHP